MPMNGFSVGRDVSLIIVTASGPLVLSLITGFQSKPDIVDVKSKGLDGITRHVRFPDGWSGSFNIDRQDSTVDDWWSQLEDNYYIGLNEQPATITQTIQEVNGAVTQYRYLQVLLKPDDAGQWAGDSLVRQHLSFVSARRRKVA